MNPPDAYAARRTLWDNLTPSFSHYPPCGWIAHARPAGVQRASQVPWLCSPCVPRPMTPAESPGPDLYGPFFLASGFTRPSPSAFNTLSRLHVASEQCGRSCGPQGSLCTLHMFRSMGCLSRSPALVISSTCATLSTGGWSGLPNRGVALLCRPSEDFHLASKARLRTWRTVTRK